MRTVIRSLAFSATLFLLGTCALARASAPTFTENLSLGSSGTEVIALQKILNQSADTRIAESGPGSPGKETGYFGSLTASAVERFQEKYASDVLLPAGLTHGTGYVGPLTRARLNALSDTTSASPTSTNRSLATRTPTASSPPNGISISPTAAASAAISTNPNLQNIGTIFADIDKVSREYGVSSSTIAIIHQKILERLATTTDLKAALLKKLQPMNAVSVNRPAPQSLFDRLIAEISDLFLPRRALAATPATLPFGGRLVGIIPCDVGFNLVVEPPLPTFPVLLYYVEGTQLFLSHNIPLPSQALLGSYTPGVWGCFFGPVPVPAEGTVTPMVGSSLGPAI